MPVRKITLDTTRMRHDLSGLRSRFYSEAPHVAMTQATTTAAKMGGLVPVRTGRLASTVGTVAVAFGAGVTYGGGLPYAPVVEKRRHPVRKGAHGSRVAFHRAMQELAATLTRQV